jgi:hypothetical protein
MKYAVDLSYPKDIHRISQAAWDDAPALKPTKEEAWPADFLADGIQYQGSLLPKSGPKWDYLQKASMSPGKSRMAVYSFDGTVTRMSEQDMSPWFWKWYGPLRGTYWTEIYDLLSARLLIQISGAFRGVDLTVVQGRAIG